MVELIGRIQTPGRAPDRNLISVRRELAGEYHCNDGSGPDIHGVMIVFCRFDDECHDPKLLFERLSLNRKPFSPLNRKLDRFRAFAARQIVRATQLCIGENNTAHKQLLTLWECHHTHIG